MKGLHLLVQIVNEIETGSHQPKTRHWIKSYLEKDGIADWTIKSSNLKEIIKDSQLTATRKKQVNRGFEVEDGFLKGSDLLLSASISINSMYKHFNPKTNAKL